MRILTDGEAREWCSGWPRRLTIDDGGRLRIATAGETLKVDTSKIGWRDLPMTARALAFLGCHDVGAFEGGLVWVLNTGISIRESEQVIRRMLEGFRRGYGELRSLETAKAHLFRPDEPDELASVAMAVLLAEWDAYLVSPSGDWTALIHHDDNIYVTARSDDVLGDLRTGLESFGSVMVCESPPLTASRAPSGHPGQ